MCLYMYVIEWLHVMMVDVCMRHVCTAGTSVYVYKRLNLDIMHVNCIVAIVMVFMISSYWLLLSFVCNIYMLIVCKIVQSI
jgi:hypothetical protein